MFNQMINVTVGLASIGIKLEDTLYNKRAFVLGDSNFQKVAHIVEFY